jgi:hypothetical protein
VPRLVSAEFLKLRKRRGLVATAVVLTVGAMLIAYAVLLALHASDPVAVVLAITLDVPSDHARAFDGLGLSLAALSVLPLLARRRAPLAGLVFVGGASAALVWLGYVE